MHGLGGVTTRSVSGGAYLATAVDGAHLDAAAVPMTGFVPARSRAWSVASTTWKPATISFALRRGFVGDAAGSDGGLHLLGREGVGGERHVYGDEVVCVVVALPDVVRGRVILVRRRPSGRREAQGSRLSGGPAFGEPTRS